MHNHRKPDSDGAFGRATEWTGNPLPVDDSWENSVRGLRFPFDLPLQYKVWTGMEEVVEGIGRTVDISNGGIRFLADRPPRVGSKMELSISWPDLVEGCASVQLFVAGEIVRGDDKESVLRIRHHEFRTRPKTDPLVGLAPEMFQWNGLVS